MASFKSSLSAVVVAVAIGLGSVAMAAPALGGANGAGASRKDASKDRSKDTRGDPRDRDQGSKDEKKDGDGGPRDNGSQGKDRGRRGAHEPQEPKNGSDRRGEAAPEGSDATDDGGNDRRGGGSVTPRGSPEGTPHATPSTQPSPVPSGSGGVSLHMTSRASRILAEVGDEIVYTVTVTNDSDGEVADIAIVDLVAAEVDVTSVPVSDDVEAAQAGRSPRGEDVVWILKKLPAGATVELSWTGVVASSGDLEATNVVQATIEGTRAARTSTTTFLGTATGVAAEKTAPQVMPRRVVTYLRVPATDPKVPGVLPATGLGVDWFVWLALGVGLAGAVLLTVGRPPSTVLRGAGIALAIVALLSFVTLPSDQSRPPSVSPTTQGDDQVKGRRIFRDNGAGQKADERGKRDARRDRREREDPSGKAPSAAEESPPTIVVRTVRTVRVPVDAAPIGDGTAANELAFTWDEDHRRIVQATSSRGPLTAAPYELLVSLGGGNGAIQATLVLRNVSDDLIALDGVLFHEIRGEGAALTLETQPIDLVLRPRGEIRATFVYLLPTGDYQTGATFVAG